MIADIRSFQFCGPSDDPDEQTAVTTGYRHLLVQLKRLSSPLLCEADALRLNAIEVEINNIYSLYEAHAEVDALIPDIEDLLQRADEHSLLLGTNAWIVESSVIDQLETAKSAKFNVAVLLQMCREINSSIAHGNVIATVLLMRAALNYVPPVFGKDSFAQVVANSSRSLKDSFDHLETGLRKVADFYTHRQMNVKDCYPSIAQVEPFKPQFELLLHEILVRL